MTATETRERPPESGEWHARTVEETVEALETDETGLSAATAQARLEAVGPNEIRDEAGVRPLALFVSQFRDVLIYVLVFAALLSVGVGLLPGGEPNYTDAGLILLILLANGVFGFVQDYRAEKSIEALREMASPTATVRRDGRQVTVDATELVPGDVVSLEAGDAVPADARLLEANSLETDESALTGESTSVAKSVDPVDADTSLAERTSMVYMNTSVVRGRGRAVVVETGMETEVGRIAEGLSTAEEQPTPFQREVDELGRRIGFGVVALIVLVVLVQFLLTAATPIAILLVGVSLAVAAVPEGLPAVVTLTLALGSRRMVARNALVRRLPVVESLGSVDVVVTDKTGTLTQNQMTVERLAFGDETYSVTGSGAATGGEFRRDGERVDPSPLEPLLRCGAVCNNAELAGHSEVNAKSESAGSIDSAAPANPAVSAESIDSTHDEFLGDPTEVALLVSARKAGVEATHERVREIPFSSERRRMTVLAREDGETTAYTKGAPEAVLRHCDRVLVDGTVQSLTDERRATVQETVAQFAGDALRVLGFATKSGVDPNAPDEAIESNLVFLGLQGMLDPPRPEVPGAVADCRNAGIRAVMVTGDNLETAKAVGESVGFDPAGAMTGREVDDYSEEELRDVVEEVEVFARADPEHKVRILSALQDNGHIVAMTGDGVNDAPALRNADVGIAMGIRGTDVAQQSSDMVLQDDNFATIRDAIAEGRGIFDNIRKFVNYLLSANAGEVLVVFVGVLLGTALFPDLFASQAEALILTPVMLLWVNLVTDGLPALALGADPKAEDVLVRPPRGRDEPVIDRTMTRSIGAIAVAMTVTGLSLFFWTLRATGDLIVAQTLLFTFLVAVEVVRIQVIRARYDLSITSNPWLLAAVATTLLLQLLVLYTPLSDLFEVVRPTVQGWLWVAAAFLAFLLLNLTLPAVLDRFDRPE